LKRQMGQRERVKEKYSNVYKRAEIRARSRESLDEQTGVQVNQRMTKGKKLGKIGRVGERDNTADERARIQAREIKRKSERSRKRGNKNQTLEITDVQLTARRASHHSSHAQENGTEDGAQSYKSNDACPARTGSHERSSESF